MDKSQFPSFITEYKLAIKSLFCYQAFGIACILLMSDLKAEPFWGGSLYCSFPFFIFAKEKKRNDINFVVHELEVYTYSLQNSRNLLTKFEKHKGINWTHRIFSGGFRSKINHNLKVLKKINLLSNKTGLLKP